MTSDEMSHAVQQFFLEADALQWKKNLDYHPDRIAFLEILRTAFECNITVEQDLWSKIRKQYIALHSYVIHGHTESEPPRQRMIDISVYMAMLAFWDRHKWRIVTDALFFMMAEQCQCSPPHKDKYGTCYVCQFATWLRIYADTLTT